MKNLSKRIIAVMLALIMLLSIVPVGVFAETESDIAKTNNVVNVNSTNSFGKMLAENFDTTVIDKSADYYVSDVQISGNKAVVEYGADDACTLVVAIYDETTNQMLASAVENVDAEEEQATVSFDSALPDYFVVKAFLLNDMNAALCSAYYNYHYTSKFERVERKTTSDFPADRVVNLDKDTTNNFFVLDSSVKKITSTQSVNTLIKSDDDNNEYVIGNIDDTVRSLQKGDTFFLRSGDNIVIVKIETMKIDGSTATFSSTAVDSDTALDYVKINSEATTDDFKADPSTLGEGIHLAESEEPLLETNSVNESANSSNDIEENIKFTPDFFVGQTETGDPDKSGLYAKISGKLSFMITGKASYYQDSDEDYKEASLSIELNIIVEIEVKAVLSYQLPICELGWAVVPGCYVGINPTFVISGTYKGKLTGTLSAGWGATYNSDRNDAWQNGLKKPTFKPVIKAEIEIFFGLDLKPFLKIVSKHLLIFELDTTVGFHFTGEVKREPKTDSKIHHCEACIDGEILFDFNIKFSVTLGKDTPFETKLAAGDLYEKNYVHIAYFYYSEDYNEFGWGQCPHCYFKVGIGVRNEEDGSAIGNAILTLTGGYSYDKDRGKFTELTGSIKTDENGDYTAYYPGGEYTIIADASNFDTNSTNIKVEEPISKEIIKLKPQTLHKVTFTVTDALTGKALSGITVTAKNGKAENNALSAKNSTTTDGSGNATLYYPYDSLEKKATFTDSSGTTHYKTVTKTLSNQVIFDNHYDIEMYECKTSKITFNVTDSESGEAISLASITLTGTEDNPYKSFGITDLNTITINGKATLDVPNGGYDVKVYATDYKSYSTTLTANGDRTVYYSLTKGEDEEEDDTDLSDKVVGDVIPFGSYPQSKVTDSSTISALDGISKNWISYNYYTGTGDWCDGNMQPSDYMKYADFKYDGNKYRAVTFSQYRPYITGYTSSASNSRQDDNGYYTGNVYYFKYEPLTWRVLDPSEGFVMCNKAIDSQAYQNFIYYNGSEYYNSKACTTYASDWATSSIKEWLNNDFYNTAFSDSEKSQIGTSYNENKSAYSSTYDSANTSDKIFLLSYNEVLNSNYGFSSRSSTSDTARQLKSTDYAKCQGCVTLTYTGNSWWRLRSPRHSSSTADVNSDGGASDFYSVSHTYYGIVPAFKINPKSSIQTSSIESIELNETESVEIKSSSTSISYDKCKAGNEYILLNVTGYGKNFALSNNNLLYIDQLTADENGVVSTTMFPKYSDSNSTTLLIGDFGSGVEVRKLSSASDDEKTSVSVSDMELKYKNSAKITPVISAPDGAKYSVEYTSSNANIVTVDNNGNITTHKKGNATVTCTVKDENGKVLATDTCNVTVKFTFGQWLIWILLLGFLWY